MSLTGYIGSTRNKKRVENAKMLWILSRTRITGLLIFHSKCQTLGLWLAMYRSKRTTTYNVGAGPAYYFLFLRVLNVDNAASCERPTVKLRLSNYPTYLLIYLCVACDRSDVGWGETSVDARCQNVHLKHCRLYHCPIQCSDTRCAKKRTSRTCGTSLNLPQYLSTSPRSRSNLSLSFW